MENINKKLLNSLLKTNCHLKKFLERSKNIVLPQVPDRGVTTEWLMKVARDEVFTISDEIYRRSPRLLQKGFNKAKIHQYLVQEAGMTTGFDDKSLPSKEWLLDCLYSLNPHHIVFQRPAVAKALALFPGG